MKILLFGKTGQLGWELERALAPLGEIHAFGSDELDLERLDLLANTIREIESSLIVNASAYTAVDRAESEAEIAMKINARSRRDGGRGAEIKCRADSLFHRLCFR